ncbi:MAG TPA: hypothetical protein VMB21_15495, partial [Candidatus Limnocylindria bacterium]|nr:hypothetical protein [Candidatus Limnocylindria bacterium]
MKSSPDLAVTAVLSPAHETELESQVPAFRVSGEGAVLPHFSELTDHFPTAVPVWDAVNEGRDEAFARPGPEDDGGVGRDFARSIINSLDAVIYTMDRDLCLTSINCGWQKMPLSHGGLKLDRPPEAGRSFLDYVGEPARRTELREILASVLATG